VYSTAKGSEFNLRAQAPGAKATVTLSGEGVVEVRCAFHPKMKLIVRVKQ
jgi:plastocyanin